MWDKPVFLNKSFSAAPASTMKLKFYINVDHFMPCPFKKLSWISIGNAFAKCAWTLTEQIRF